MRYIFVSWYSSFLPSSRKFAIAFTEEEWLLTDSLLPSVKVSEYHLVFVLMKVKF